MMRRSFEVNIKHFLNPYCHPFHWQILDLPSFEGLQGNKTIDVAGANSIEPVIWTRQTARRRLREMVVLSDLAPELVLHVASLLTWETDNWDDIGLKLVPDLSSINSSRRTLSSTRP